MRKKIVIFTYSLEGGGAERTVANLLGSLDRTRYEIHLVLMNTNIAYSIPNDQIVHFIEKSNQYELDIWKLIKLPFLASRLSKYCKAQNIELVFSLMNRPNMVATMAKSFGLKAKVLISERFYTPYFYNTKTLAGKFKTWLLKKCYSRADCILPNSQGTIEALQNEMNISTNYKLIKNTTDLRAISKLKLETVADHVDFGKFTFVNVSAFRAEKNHDLLIDSVDKLRDRNFQLLLIGKGYMFDQLNEKVKRLGLEMKILFIPYAENPFKYLYRSSCFLLSSFGEGFPNILIESMACGLPVISVDCKTGPRELLAPGTDLNTVIAQGTFEIAKYGVLCETNSTTSFVAAMNWAMDNPQSLNNYKSIIGEKAMEFDIKKVTEDLSKTFDQYLESPVKAT